MPCVWIEYDKSVVSDTEAEALCRGSKDAVVAVHGSDDVYVWGNSSDVKTEVDPVEIFIECSAHVIGDVDQWSAGVSEGLRKWKAESGFNHPINLTVTPMHWKITLAI